MENTPRKNVMNAGIPHAIKISTNPEKNTNILNSLKITIILTIELFLVQIYVNNVFPYNYP